MRIGIGTAAVFVGLLLAAPGWAQTTVTFGGVNPAQIQNKPVVTPDVAKPIAAPQLLPQNSFRLSRFLPKITLPAAGHVFGQSQFPTPANMPGKNYLKSFGFSRPAPIQP
jgi:hypothetical protein